MMKITLYTAPIFTEVRRKSHLEVQNIKDVEERDNARAGIEKSDEIYRCLDEAFGQIARICGRFLTASYWSEVDDLGDVPETYSFEFEFSERRGVSKSEPLTKALHAYAVQYTLARFSASVGQQDASAKHEWAVGESARQIEELLYTKQPPIL